MEGSENQPYKVSHYVPYVSAQALLERMEGLDLFNPFHTDMPSTDQVFVGSTSQNWHPVSRCISQFAPNESFIEYPLDYFPLSSLNVIII